MAEGPGEGPGTGGGGGAGTGTAGGAGTGLGVGAGTGTPVGAGTGVGVGAGVEPASAPLYEIVGGSGVSSGGRSSTTPSKRSFTPGSKAE